MDEYRSDWIAEHNNYRYVSAGTGQTYKRIGRPLIVCLCGSTRFYQAFQEANYRETMAGRIVLSVGHYPHAAEQAYGEHVGCTPEQKAALDVLHKQKIDLADEVLVLNVGGYVGESTRSEVQHALKCRKPVRWLEPDKVPAGLAMLEQ